MIVRLSVWEQIRDQFSDDERDQLNAVRTGEAWCPRGVVIDQDLLAPALREKILRLGTPRKGAAA